MLLLAVAYQSAQGTGEAADVAEGRLWGTGVEEVQRRVALWRCQTHEPVQPVRNLPAVRQPATQAGAVCNGLTDHLVGPATESRPRRWFRRESEQRTEQGESAFLKFGG